MDRPLPAYRGDEPYVFVCYSHEDKGFVYAEIAWLQQRGVNVWFDQGISPGHEWSEELGEAIDRAQRVLFFVTPSSVSSKHCRNEIHYAQNHDVPILALHLKPTTLPPGLELALGASQAVLAYELPKRSYRQRAHAALSEGRVATNPRNRSTAPSKTKGPRRTYWAVSAASVAILVLGFGVWFTIREAPSGSPDSPPMATSVPEKSIAVLPFADMSQHQDQGYLADGMAEEIISLLSRVRDLRVLARTSSFYFKGSSVRTSEIARQLKVSHVLEGSIQALNDRIRVTVQLVQADTGYQLWSQAYDRDLKDVFAVQDEIANAVVQALQIQLSGGPLNRSRGGTQNLEAYQLYLKGIAEIFSNTRQSLDAASEYFKQSIARDPSYGLAWHGMANVAMIRADNGFVPSREGYEDARQLAQQALQLSPELADAHAVLQYVYRTLDWNWPAAEIEGQRALSIDPRNVLALVTSGMLFYTQGRWDASERALRLALAEDPLNSYAIWNLGTMYYSSGRYAQAEQAYRRLIEVAPGFLWARSYLGKTLLAEGKPDAALQVIEKEPDDDMRLIFLPSVLLAAGRAARQKGPHCSNCDVARSRPLPHSSKLRLSGQRGPSISVA